MNQRQKKMRISMLRTFETHRHLPYGKPSGPTDTFLSPCRGGHSHVFAYDNWPTSTIPGRYSPDTVEHGQVQLTDSETSEHEPEDTGQHWRTNSGRVRKRTHVDGMSMILKQQRTKRKRELGCTKRR